MSINEGAENKSALKRASSVVGNVKTFHFIQEKSKNKGLKIWIKCSYLQIILMCILINRKNRWSSRTNIGNFFDRGYSYLQLWQTEKTANKNKHSYIQTSGNMKKELHAKELKMNDFECHRRREATDVVAGHQPQVQGEELRLEVCGEAVAWISYVTRHERADEPGQRHRWTEPETLMVWSCSLVSSFFLAMLRGSETGVNFQHAPGIPPRTGGFQKNCRLLH